MAFERLAYLEAVIGADITAFRRGMRDVRNELGIMSETMRGISAIGRTMTFTITAPLLALGSFAAQAAAEFDASMRNVNAIAGLTEESFQRLTQEVLEFSGTIRSGPAQAAEALYTTMQAGITDVNSALQVMEVASFTAEAGLSSIETTTEALIASFLAYRGLSLDLAQQQEMLTLHSNALTQMVVVGVGTMEEFANAVGQVLPQAVAVNMSIEELYGNIAFLTQRGLSASKAAVSMNAALTSLAKPTEAMQAAFSKLGVTGIEDLIKKTGSVNNALKALIGTTDGTQASIQALFNNIRGARAINLFANDMEGWNKALDEFNESIEGATMRVWEEQMKSFTAQFDLMKSAIEAAAIAIGSQILPLILPFVQSITQAAIRFTELNPEIIKFGVVVAGAVAAAGPLLWLLGSLATPFGAIIAGIGLLSATFITKWDEIERTVKTAVTNILGEDGLKKLENIWDTIKTIMFPEDEAGKSLFPPPVEITVDDLITVKPGDTLWSIFQENYADQYTWERFKEIVGLPKSGNQHILQVGEILTIPADLGRQFNTALEKAFKGREVFGIADWVDDADLRGPGGINFAQTVPVRDNPIVEGIMNRLRAAFSAVAPQAEPLIHDMWSAIIALIPKALGLVIGGPAGLVIGFAPEIAKALGIEISELPTLVAGMNLAEEFKKTAQTVLGQIIAAFDSVIGEKKIIPDDATRGFREFGQEIDYAPTSRQNAMAALFTGLKNLFSGVVAAFILEFQGLEEGLKGVISGIKGFVDGLATEIDVDKALKAVGTLGTLFGALGIIGGAILSFGSEAFGKIIDNTLPSLGAALGHLVNIVSSIVTGDFKSAGTELVNFGNKLQDALLGIPLGIAETLWDKVFSGTQMHTVREGLRGWVNAWESFKVIVSTIWRNITGDLELTRLKLKLSLNNAARDVLTWIQNLPEPVRALMGLGGILGQHLEPAILALNMSDMRIRTEMADIQFERAIADELSRQLGEIIIKPDKPLAIETELGTVGVGPQGTPLLQHIGNMLVRGEMSPETKSLIARWLSKGIQDALAQGNIEEAHRLQFWAGLFGEPTDTVGNFLANQISQNEAADQAAVEAAMSGLAEAAERGFKNNAKFENPMANLVTELQNNQPTVQAEMEALVGPESTVMSTFSNFVSKISEGASGIISSFLSIKTDSTPHLTALANSLKPEVDKIVKELARIKDEAYLAAAALSSVDTAQLTAGGVTPPNPAGLFGGGDVYAGGIYKVGETGPEYFVPGMDGQIIPGHMVDKKRPEPVHNNNEIHIHGVQDVDGILYELRRRGVVL